MILGGFFVDFRLRNKIGNFRVIIDLIKNKTTSFFL